MAQPSPKVLRGRLKFQRRPERIQHLRYLSDGDPWMLAEEIPDCDFFFLQIWTSGFVQEFLWPTGRTFRKVLSIHRGYHLWFYFGEKDSHGVGEFLVDKMVRNPRFAARVNRGIIQTSDALRHFSGRIPGRPLSSFTNRQLWHVYQKHDRLHTRYYQWGWIPVAADMFHGNLTERLKQHLRSIGVAEDRLNEYFLALTQPTKKSPIQTEREEFLALAAFIQRRPVEQRLFVRAHQTFRRRRVDPHQADQVLEQALAPITGKLKPATVRRIRAHYQKYYYINHMWVGRAYTLEHYLKELAIFLDSKLSAAKLLTAERRKFRQAVERRQKLLKKLSIRGGWRLLFDAFGDFMVTKIYRRFAQIYALYRMEPVLSEIARRLGLTLKQVRFLLPREVGRALQSAKIDRAEINRRVRFCVHYCEHGREELFTGARARKLAREAERRTIGAATELKGQTACIGKVAGVVKIIIRPSDMHKMNPGDILVSIATDPDIVPAMKKAAAIVTEQGGVTSHAAIVSRELGIPCVIGTKIATKVLKDGDVVEVDANHGVVMLLKRPA